MDVSYIEKEIDYDGLQLSPHYIYNRFGLVGDAVVAFCGKAVVPLEHMVDQEDVKKEEHIYSERMLHFLGEFFEQDLQRAVYRQRLYMSIINEYLPSDFVRSGDDIYLDDRKLSVSIATVSPVSTLIHIGLNISSQNTPVKTVGLDDLELDSVKFAKDILGAFGAEETGVRVARCKVRGVS